MPHCKKGYVQSRFTEPTWAHRDIVTKRVPRRRFAQPLKASSWAAPTGNGPYNTDRTLAKEQKASPFNTCTLHYLDTATTAHCITCTLHDLHTATTAHCNSSTMSRVLKETIINSISAGPASCSSSTNYDACK